MNIGVQRYLAQILISKDGGNVDHNDKSVLIELFDNSIDSKCNKIICKIIKENGTQYLIVYDNGNGIQNLNNLLDAKKGKTNKIGKKNQGFLDSLVYLSKLDGVHYIYTNNNGILGRLKINLKKLRQEYDTQIKLNDDIDYSRCQDKLDTVINDNQDTREFLKNNKTISNLLKNSGTYIKIELGRDINFPNIEYFQYMYTSYDFKLFLKDEKTNICVDINKKKNICLTDKYVKFYMKIYKHIKGNKLFIIRNSVNKDQIYYKKTKQNINELSIETYSKLKDQYEEIYKGNDIEVKFNLISNADAQKQCNIFGCSIEDLRNIWIETNGKLLGFPISPKITGWYPRNLKDIRLVIKVNNLDIITNITMMNKSKTNLNNGDGSIIKLIKYIKDYLNLYKHFSYKTSKEHIGYGIKNIEKYILNLKTEVEPPLPSPPLPSPLLPSLYCAWNSSAYFGILECEKNNGILLQNNYIRCKFGFTDDDPKNRDITLKSKWRRIISVFINDKAREQNEGKITLEWKIKQALMDSKLNIIWDSNEYFRCNRIDFTKIYKIVRTMMFKYENKNVFMIN